MTTLTQTENSITNTLITGSDGRVVYEVSTPTALFSTKTTTISRQGSIIANIEWHKFGGSIMRFEGREVLLDDVFLKSGPLSRSRTYVTRSGVSLKWKSKLGELYCVAPGSDANIATYHRVKFAPFRTTRSSLFIHQLGLGIVDELVITWVIMEKLATDRRRQAARSAAAG